MEQGHIVSAANFVMGANPPEPYSSETTMYVCKECDEDVPVLDTDSHAVRRHKASSIRVFQTETGYAIWVMEQEELRKIREHQSRE